MGLSDSSNVETRQVDAWLNLVKENEGGISPDNDNQDDHLSAVIKDYGEMIGDTSVKSILKNRIEELPAGDIEKVRTVIHNIIQREDPHLTSYIRSEFNALQREVQNLALNNDLQHLFASFSEADCEELEKNFTGPKSEEFKEKFIFLCDKYQVSDFKDFIQKSGDANLDKLIIMSFIFQGKINQIDGGDSTKSIYVKNLLKLLEAEGLRRLNNKGAEFLNSLAAQTPKAYAQLTGAERAVFFNYFKDVINNSLEPLYSNFYHCKLDEVRTILDNLNFMRAQGTTSPYKHPIFTKIAESLQHIENVLQQDAFTKDHSQLHPLDKITNWHHFIVRKKDWNSLIMYNNQGTQQPYGQRMGQAIHITADAIKEGKSFEEILGNCANLRLKIAIDLNYPIIKGYGLPRTERGETRFESVYEKLGLALKKKISLTDATDPNISMGEHGKSATVIATLNGEQVPLTKINFELNKIEHTDQIHIPKILAHVDELYKKAMASHDEKEILEISGQIYWWICQAKPWSFGDPSIAEMLVRAIHEAKGMDSQPWKMEIVPWETTVLAFNPEEYGRKFADLFESKG